MTRAIIIERMVYSMNIYEAEKKLIENRMLEIKNDMHDIKRVPRNIVIAGGEPVLDVDAEEFKKLQRMMEILKYDRKQDFVDEYSTLRENTKLGKMDEESLVSFRENLDALSKEDRADLVAVRERMKSVQDAVSYNESIPVYMRKNEDELKAELKTLKRLEEILLRGLRHNYRWEYKDLWDMTGLSKMSRVTENPVRESSIDNKEEYEEEKVEPQFRPVAEEKIDVPSDNLSKIEILATQEQIAEKESEVQPAEQGLANRKMDFDEIKAMLQKEEDRRREAGILADSNSSLASEVAKRSIQSDESIAVNGVSTNIINQSEGLAVNDYNYGEEQPTLEGVVLGAGNRSSGGPRNRKVDISAAIDADYSEVIDDPIETQLSLGPGTKQEIAVQGTDTQKDDDDDLIEVVKVTPWEWIQRHRKQILIALGVTAITISVVVLMTQLWPAIKAMETTKNVAGMLADMVRNSKLWHTADAGGKLFLHGSSVDLAGKISQITGVASSYDAALGTWSFGTQSLGQFASSAASAAASAADKVAKFTSAVDATKWAGIGLMGAGVLIPNKKSKAYKSIKQSIDNLKKASSSMSEEDKSVTGGLITEKITTSTELSEAEKRVLLKKLQNVLKKKKGFNLPSYESVNDILTPEEEAIQEQAKAM